MNLAGWANWRHAYLPETHERTKLIRGRAGEASGLRCAEGVVSGSLKSSEQRDFRRTSPTQTMGAQRPINIDDESLPAPPCLDRPRQPKSRKPNKNGVFSLSRAEPLKHAPPRSPPPLVGML